MQFKLFRYQLSTTDGKIIHPDKHFKLFEEARGPDEYGRFAEYRGKKDSVLMHLRNYDYDFVGLVGRHSTEREVTSYDVDEDMTVQVAVDDDDYPHAAFVCLPRTGMITCTDRGSIRAIAALSRLHKILAHRKHLLFIFEEIKEAFDLRKAIKRFRLIEVTFEILPVNPHTEDLGIQLDQSRKLDHIKKINGAAHGAISEPLTLDGGFLTAVQQLQKSGHAKVGFKGYTHDTRIEVSVPKPTQVKALSEHEDQEVSGENVGVRINIPGRQEYPFPESFVHEMRQIAISFTKADLGDSDE
jgi:hypothetical protein